MDQLISDSDATSSWEKWNKNKIVRVRQNDWISSSNNVFKIVPETQLDPSIIFRNNQEIWWYTSHLKDNYFWNKSINHKRLLDEKYFIKSIIQF